MSGRNIFSPDSRATSSRIRGAGRAHWSEDAYIPAEPGGLQLALRLTRNRIVLACLFVIGGYLLLLGRAFALQIVSGQQYLENASYNRLSERVIKPNRGLLYDRFGTALVQNKPRFALKVDPRLLPADQQKKDEYLQSFSAIVPLENEKFDVLRRTTSKSSPFTLDGDIDEKYAYSFFARADEFPAFSVSTTSIRSYPSDLEFSHIFGYIGRLTAEDVSSYPDYQLDDFIGRTGLEKQYENLLRGVPGKKIYEVDATVQAQRLISEQQSQLGKSLILGIDSELQKKLYQELEQAIGKTSSPGGVAIAIDPRDGAVRALVNYPSFSLSAFQRGLSSDEYKVLAEDPRKPLFNRAVTGEYPSGSTIKPFVGLAGLETGVITPSTTFQSTGGLRIGQWFFPDWKAGGHGTTDIRKAIAESVNTYFYIVGGGDNADRAGLGAARMKEYLEKYGFGKKTGIDIPAERDGFLPSSDWKSRTKKEQWYLGDTYHFAIGQGDLLATPLQVASSTTAIANGGTYYQPRFVVGTRDESTGTLDMWKPVVKSASIAKQSNVEVIRQGMRLTVTGGSARQLQNVPVPVAAKTGTAQFGPGEKTHAWISTFAPYENPELVLVVLVEEGGQGSSIGQQIALQTLQWYFSSEHRAKKAL